MRLDSIGSRTPLTPGAARPGAPALERETTPTGDGGPSAIQAQLRTDAFDPATAQPPVTLAAATPAGGQRERALAVTRECPPGSVGAAIRPLLSGAMSVLDGAAGTLTTPLAPAAGMMVNRSVGRPGSEFAAGAVGDFYEQHRELLQRPATNENIAEFTRLETEFFQGQPGLAGAIGGMVPAELRDLAVRGSRNVQQLLPW